MQEYVIDPLVLDMFKVLADNEMSLALGIVVNVTDAFCEFVFGA